MVQAVFSTVLQNQNKPATLELPDGVFLPNVLLLWIFLKTFVLFCWKISGYSVVVLDNAGFRKHRDEEKERNEGFSQQKS